MPNAMLSSQTYNSCLKKDVSPIYLVPKADRCYRVSLKLKELSQHVINHHAIYDGKLNSLRKTALRASLGLEDAYYFIPVARKIANVFAFSSTRYCIGAHVFLLAYHVAQEYLQRF